MGATKDDAWKHVLGPYGDSRRTKGGEELLHFCEQEGLVVAGSFTKQREKATWFHFRWGNVAARLMDPPPTKTFGLNNLEPGAPLGGLAQDLGTFD